MGNCRVRSFNTTVRNEYEGDDYAVSVIEKLSDYIKKETLAKEITKGTSEDAQNVKSFKINGSEVTISVSKA